MQSARIDVRGCDRANRGQRATFILPAEPIERLPACDRPRIVRPAEWRRRVRTVLATAVPSPASLLAPARASFDILPFQLEPALAVTTGAACRVLIADEVGLGKTIQATLIACELLERVPDGHVLIVAPAGLRTQWREEIARLFRRNVAIVDSTSILETTGSAVGNPWTASPIAITSIDFVKRPEVLRSLESIVWDAIVFDEAHGLAGASDRHAAAASLACRARHVILLTATPHSGDDDAFERLRCLGDLDRRFPLLVFRRTRAEAGVPTQRRTTWLPVRPTEAERHMHRALAQYARAVRRESEDPAARLAMTVLARRAASSSASLARSVERRIALLSAPADTGHQLQLPMFDPAGDDELPDALLSVPGLSDGALEREWLARLLTLARRAATSESKVAALTRLLRRARTPALVFTEYRDTLEHIAAPLGGRVVRLHGGLTAAERDEAAARFTRGDAEVMVATDAASEGLNLQRRCHLIVNVELPWNPVRLEQRIGRVDRIGQRHTVHAVHFVAKDTIEDRIAARLLRRAEHARSALDGNAAPAHPRTPHLRTAHPRTPAPSHLRTLATSEATRIARARALLARGEDDVSIERPLLTRCSRRRGWASACWAFRVLFEDGRGDVLWEAVFGLEAMLLGRVAPTRADVRTALAVGDLVHRTAVEAALALEPDVRDAFERFNAVSTARLHAIRRDVEAGHARMAIGLVQRSLLDRRAERAAAAQAAVAAEALRSCAERLLHLDAGRSIAAGRTELAFAIVRQ